MSLTLKNENEVPPQGWRYLQSETAVWIKAPSWDQLVREVKKHRTANKIPIGLKFEQQIIDQMCSFLPAEWCSQTDPDLGRVTHSTVTFKQAVDTGKMFLDWFVKFGRKKVSVEQATERAATCVRCPYNQKLADCSNCSMRTIRNIVNVIVGGYDTEHDQRLEACAVCGCELRAKTRLPIELLAANLPPEKLSEFPNFCWLPKEIAAL